MANYYYTDPKGTKGNVPRNMANDERDQYDVANPYYNAYLSPTNSAKSGRDVYYNYTPKAGTNPVTPTNNNGYGTPNYYAMLANYYKQQNEQAKKTALDAIDARLKANTDLYNNQMPQVDAAYQKLIDQNELSRYRTQASIREALANRGQLDSGLGRQEMLNATAKNSANLNNIKLERQGARNDIQNAIAQLNAQANEDRANVNATYTQALADWVSKQK